MILLNSCGLESAVLLHARCLEGQNVRALYVHEGLKFSDKQEEYWRRLCLDDLDCEFTFARVASVPMSMLLIAQKDGILGHTKEAVARYLGEEAPPPEGNVQYQELGAAAVWYVPQRYATLLSVAVAAAECFQEDLELATCKREIHADDNTPDYLQSLAQTLSATAIFKPKIFFPFAEMSYRDVVSLGLKNECPIKKVWTCINSLDRLCGICSVCLERRKILTSLGKAVSDGQHEIHRKGRSAFGRGT